MADKKNKHKRKIKHKKSEQYNRRVESINAIKMLKQMESPFWTDSIITEKNIKK